MKYYLRSKLLLLIICFVSLNIQAQESSCSFKLQEAESLYETGILDSIPAMLRSCLNNNGFDNEELARAYKLLILTYQFEDYQEMAELTMLKFLKDFPEYELKATDPIEFKYLYNSYQTIPSFSVGIILGGNYSMIRIIEPYTIGDPEDYQGEYTPGISFQAGLQFKKYITNEIDINLDVIYTNTSFDYSIEQLDHTTKYKEVSSLLSIPVSATYDFKMGQLSPYLRIGASLDYMLTASADLEKINTTNIALNQKETDIDVLEDRNVMNISALAGGGVKWNIKMGYVMFDVRYHYSFMNIVNGDNRMDDLKLGSYNYYEDDFTTHNLYFSIGWVYSFYKTKHTK